MAVMQSNISNPTSMLSMLQQQMMITIGVNMMLLSFEIFLFLSVFIMSYKTFQILEARQSSLFIGDYVRLMFNKFYRITIAYYTVWFLLWTLASRITNGPIWHNVLKN